MSVIYSGCSEIVAAVIASSTSVEALALGDRAVCQRIPWDYFALTPRRGRYTYSRGTLLAKGVYMTRKRRILRQ